MVGMQRNRTPAIRPGSRKINGGRATPAAIARAGLAVVLAAAALAGCTSQPAQTASSRAAAPALTRTSFAGYPGQTPLPGAPRLEVNAIAVVNGERLAVGAAGGYPAIWRQDTSGSWKLVSSPQPASQPSALMTVAHGTAGWLAIGVPGPVSLISADGETWRPGGPGSSELGAALTISAAAGPRGYVVLGKQLAASGQGCVADVWWSPDLTTWTRAHDVNEINGSSQTLAVAATADGFVSVGSHNGRPAAWVTPNGVAWRTIDLPGPANAELNAIAVHGDQVVAVGGTDGQGGTPAFAVYSADGGTRWQQAPLGLPGPSTVITALAATSQGFIAAGRYGTPGQQRVVVWEMPAGRTTWTQAHISGITDPGTGRPPAVTALGASGGVVTGIGPVAPAASAQAYVFTLAAR